MALWSIGSLGTLIGSWMQQRWGCRKGLFYWGIGASRLVWLAVGLIPVLRPQWAQSGPALYWLTSLTLLFYFVHSLGNTAWLSWMADLIPAHMQSQYWSLRQLGASSAGILARIGFGFY